MGKHSNERKSATLGMPHGTAQHRLRKNIMFQYVERCGDNFCFKCGAEIESPETMSIEHKLPWEGVSADLFWSLDNIAFSHVQCNRPHSYRGRERLPDALANLTCSRCGQAKHKDSFHLRGNGKWNSWCQDCRKLTNYGKS